MNLRLAAALLITLVAASVARADVPAGPLPRSPGGIAMLIGTVVAGVALTAGIVIAGLIWVRRSGRPGDISEVAAGDTGGTGDAGE